MKKICVEDFFVALLLILIFIFFIGIIVIQFIYVIELIKEKRVKPIVVFGNLFIAAILLVVIRFIWIMV